MDGTRRGRRLLVSLCFLCLAVLLPGALLASPAAGRKRRQAGFDHYVLALQWPGTVCRQTNHCCSSNGCCRYGAHSLPFLPCSRIVVPPCEFPLIWLSPFACALQIKPSQLVHDP